MDQVAFSFSIKPLSPHTGAEIYGIELRQPVDEATRMALNQAFADHAMLAIRDQNLSAPQFLQAMKLFGEIFPQHNSRFRVPECPAIHYISNQDKLEDGRVYIPGEGYHTDHSNDAEPPNATALHAVKLPKTGGDTQFVNMYEAYDTLPESVKRKIDGLKARHVYEAVGSGPARAMLECYFGEVGDADDLVAMVRQYAANGKNYDGQMARLLRAIALHQEPVQEGSNSFYIYPASVTQLRKNLFGFLRTSAREAGLAKQCLVAIDILRDEYGIAVNDARHPDVLSDIPWPPEAARS